MLNKKYEAKQKEYEKYQNDMNNKFIMDCDKEMRLEELEIVNKTQEGKIKLTQKNIEVELLNINAKAEKFMIERDEAKKDQNLILITNNNLLKQNQDLNNNVARLTIEIEDSNKKRMLEKERYENQILKLNKKANDAMADFNISSQESNNLRNQFNELSEELEDTKNALKDKKNELIELKKKLILEV